MTKFHFITVVWGEIYTSSYINIVLPTQLSQGNLIYFQGMSKSIYHIYTTSLDFEVIKNSLSYLKLTEIMATEIHFIDGIDLKVKHIAMAECHKLAIKRGDREGCAMIFLSPDAICSDGTFMNILKLSEKGIRAVMVAGIRTKKETFIPSLLEQNIDNNGFSITLSPRQLVKIAMKNLHPMSESLFLDSKQFNNGLPSHLYFNANGEGLLARCFHLHPIMVNPTVRGKLPSGTIDYDYISLSFQNQNQIHVVSDSDEIAICEFSVSDQWGKFPNSKFSIWQIALWVAEYTNHTHRNFVKKKIYFHSKDIASHWVKIEHDSDIIIQNILQFAEFLEYWQIYRLAKLFRLTKRIFDIIMKYSLIAIRFNFKQIKRK